MKNKQNRSNSVWKVLTQILFQQILKCIYNLCTINYPQFIYHPDKINQSINQ